jgi:hypothetical protein
MQRYIDADKIDFRMPYYPDEDGSDALVSLKTVKRCIAMTPTEDVVPRSTIDEIFALIWDAFQSTYYDSEFEEKFDEIEKKYTGVE